MFSQDYGYEMAGGTVEMVTIGLLQYSTILTLILVGQSLLSRLIQVKHS
jgi:hypothetical protein